MSKPKKDAKASTDNKKQPAVSTTTGASTAMPVDDGGTADAGAASTAAPADVAANVDRSAVEASTSERQANDAPAGGSEMSSPVTLIGSSVQPALITIDREEYPLGRVVAFAHETSGLSVEHWNALPDDEREAHVERAIAYLTDAAERANNGSLYVTCWPLKFAGKKFPEGSQVPPLSQAETESLLKVGAIRLPA